MHTGPVGGNIPSHSVHLHTLSGAEGETITSTKQFCAGR